MTLPLQEVLEGKYEILEKIGEGGIGSVYKVRHRLLEEVRVIKVLRPHAASKEDLQRRFLREAKMAIRLKHPNIAQLYDFSITDDGTAYIVLEFIDGVGLDSILRAMGPPSVDLTLELSEQALGALGYLHRQKFVHRDISPDNLMLSASFDSRPVVKLIDLGIAKNLEAQAQLTETGVFLGKVRYSSPEQFSAKAGTEELDHRSDIYSFGVMLYQLLTGEYPFVGESFTELAGSHLFHQPRSFDETDTESRVAQGLREVVFKALEKEPQKRFGSAKEFAQRLAEFRDPDRSLEEELNKTIEKTVAALPQLEEFKGPGSTQDRLNRDFGLTTTPSPQAVSEITRQQTALVAPEKLKKDVSRIEKLLASGKLEKASAALAKAIAEHGQSEQLLALRERLTEVPTTVPARPSESHKRTGITLGIAAAAVLAFVGIGWVVFGRGGKAGAAEPIQLVQVQQARPWDAGEAEPDLVFRVIPEPPADEEEIVDQRASTPVAAQPAVQRRPPPPRPGEEDRPVGAEGPPPPGPGGEALPPPDNRPPPRAAHPPPIPRTEEVYKMGVGVVAPVLLQLPRPIYPDGKSPKNDVAVILRVLVDEHGRVLAATATSGPSFKRKVKEAAVNAAEGATFRPAMKDGIAGRMYVDIKIVFPAG